MKKAYILNNTLLVESSSIIDPRMLTYLEQALVLVQQRLQVFASDVEFAQKMALAFGEGGEVNSLKAAWLTGDYTIFPEIEIRHVAELNRANAAYGTATNRIYLSWEFLQANQGDIESFVGLLLEEIGHRIDVILNSSDITGDEGAIFSALVRGKTLSEKDLAQLQTEDDRGVIYVNGDAITVEQNTEDGLQPSDDSLTSNPTVDQPNLVIREENLPTKAGLGEPLYLTWTVTNESQIIVPSFKSENEILLDAIYLSKDITLDEEDQILGASFYYSDLEPNTSVQNNGQISGFIPTIPSNIEPGTWHLIIQTDSAQIISESNENDNILVQQIEIGKPNLSITSVNAPSSVDKGENIEVTWTVTNTGEYGIGQHSNFLYWSEDKILDSNDTFSQFILSPTSLKAGESYTQKQQITVPTDLSFTQGYLLVQTNAGNTQTETDETDNTGVSSLINLAGSPNLVISGDNLPTQAGVGEPINLTWTVTNQSQVNIVQSQNFLYDQVYLSKDSTLDEQDQAIGFGSFYLNLAANESKQNNITAIIPSDLDIGTWYLIIQSDNAQIISESNENDNILVQHIEIGGPNLTVTSVNTPSNASLGENTEISWIVTNIGEYSTTQSWRDYIYWSEDEFLNVNDTYITYFNNLNNLAPGESYTQQQQITLPTNLTSIGGYILVETNGNNSLQSETNLTDNSRASQVVNIAPNLVISSENLPSQAAVGESLNISWIITNESEVVAQYGSTFSERIYLSQDSKLDGEDKQLDFLSESGFYLSSNESTQKNKTVTIPSNLDVGTWYLLIQTDASQKIRETNENDNIIAQKIEIGKVDLFISNIAVGNNQIVAGENLNITWTLTNQGNGDTYSNWIDYVYLSKDNNIFTISDNLRYEYQHQADLSKLASVDQQITIPIPSNFNGDYNLIIVTDATNQIFEGNEENNNTQLYNQKITITNSQPNLQITNINALNELFLGQETVINWTVTNAGNGATANQTWNEQVWLSLDNQIQSNQDINLGTVNNLNNLISNDAYNNSLTITIPDSIPEGNYFLIIETDYNNAVTESAETDNFKSKIVQVKQLPPEPKPDLQVTNVQTVNRAIAGKNITLSYNVTNFGSVATSASSWVDSVYLSTDQEFDPVEEIFLGNYQHNGTLNTNQSYSVDNVTFNLPNNLEGNFYVFVTTDTNNQVVEDVFESNNANYDNDGLTVYSTLLPDLEIELTAPAQVRAGEKLTINYQIQNNGLAVTPNQTWKQKFYLSKKTTLDVNSAIYLGQANYQGIIEQSNSVNLSFETVVDYSLEGFYYIYGVTDSDNSIVEIFEDNNTNIASNTLEIISLPPDLLISDVTVTNNAEAGESININWRVTNQGSGDSFVDSWVDAVYLQDALGIKRLLNTFTHQGLLNIGEFYNQSQSVTIPNNIEGNYSIYVITDFNNQVFEKSKEENNQSLLQPINIILNVPDLVANIIDAPSQVEANQSVLLSWQVSNQGTRDSIVEGWIDRVYLVNEFGERTLLRSFTHNGLLNTGESYTRQELVQIPFNFVGNYSLLVETDSFNQVNEAALEGNNQSQLKPITVNRRTADLQVTSISFNPESLQFGEKIGVNWEVKNNGDSPTNSNYWYDSVYLSLDSVYSQNDIYLGRILHSNALTNGQSYQAAGKFTIPAITVDNYHVIVRTDSSNLVFEPNLDNNNDAVSSNQIAITANTQTNTNLRPAKDPNNPDGETPSLPPELAPDLVVTSVNVNASEILTNQSLEVTWTVENQRYTVGDQIWYDTVYLSPQAEFNAENAIAIGSRLGSGDSYTKTDSFLLPRGLEGNYYIHVVTDSNHRIVEVEAEANNSKSTSSLIQIAAIEDPTVFDLIVGDITFNQNQVDVGNNLSITYTITNQGEQAISGSWVDSVYLSSDNQWDVNDVFLGKVNHTGGVAAQGIYSESLTAKIPGLSIGDYYVIVRSDIQNQIPEADELNNRNSSNNQVKIDVPLLELGTPVTGTLSQNQGIYYRIEIEAGESLFVKFDSELAEGFNELYISYGDVPTRGNFDFRYDTPFEADQEILIPTTQAGTYYLLAYGNDLPTAASTYTLSAETIDFEVFDKTYGIGGTAGKRTIEINGNKFDRNVIAKLIGENGFELTASEYYWIDSTKFYATFDLTQTNAGVYDVVLINSADKELIVEDSFEVVTGGGGSLKVSLDVPNAVIRPQRDPATPFQFSVTWFNDGINDVVPTILDISSSAPISLDPNKISKIGITNNENSTYLFGSGINYYSTLESDDLPGIILPGEYAKVPIYGLVDPNPESIITSVDYTNSNKLNDAFPWENIKKQLQPLDMSEKEFEPVFNQLVIQVGSTWGDYLKMLGHNANLLPSKWGDRNNPNRLLALEVDKAKAAVNTSISGFVSTENLDIELGGRTITVKSITNNQIFTTVVLNDGSFVFSDLPVDKYQFFVSDLLLQNRSSLLIDLKQGEKITNLDIAVQQGLDFKIKVLNYSNNHYIENASVTVFLGEEAIGGGITDAQGQVIIPALEPGSYNLWIESSNFARTIVNNIELTEQTGFQSIKLVSESIITGNVLFSDETNSENVVIFATLQGQEPSIFSIYTDIAEDGKFQISGLSQGIYELNIFSDGYQLETIKDVVVNPETETKIGEIKLKQEVDTTSSSPQLLASGSSSSLSHLPDLLIWEGLWRTVGYQITKFIRGKEFADVLLEYLGNDYFISYRTFTDGSETVEVGGGANVGFRNHPTTNNRFEDAFVAAVSKVYEILSEEIKEETENGIPGYNSSSHFNRQSREYDIWELVDPSLLYVTGDKNLGDPNWNFQATLAGGLGYFGDPNIALIPDSREINGKVYVEWLDNCNVKVSAKDFSMFVVDGFDFLPGNTLTWETPLQHISLSQLRLLEYYHHAYDVGLLISWKDDKIRSREFNLFSKHQGDCDPLSPKEEKEIPKVNSRDPNDILGPKGFGEENWIPGDEPLNYTIRFENDPKLATAPAQKVRITQQLDSDLDFRSFRLGDFGFGEFIFDVPENQPYYQTRLDLIETYGIYVDVFASIDVNTKEIFWEFTSIDPETGEIPTNPLTGFLPPNLNGTEGQGFATYTINAIEDLPTGTVIDAQATIFFDNNEPIDTPPIFNTIDNGEPTSTVQPLPTVSNNPEILVQWTGTEEESGSAIQSYTVYVSKNGEPFTSWLENTTLTEATYIGEMGNTYKFYSVAIDNAGNQQNLPITAQAVISIDDETVDIPPEVKEAIAPVIVNEDAENTTIDLSNVFTDVDNDDNAITKSVITNTNESLVTATIVDNQLILNYQENHSGIADITILGTSNNLSIDTTFTITVNSVNDAPTLENALADQIVNEDTAFNFTIPDSTFSDVDTGDILTYTTTLDNSNPLPSWLSFNAANRTFSGTPTNSEVGSVNIKVTATDKAGATANNTFTITVANTNDAPTLENAIADQIATEDTTFTFTIPENTFADVDTGDSLSYSAILKDGSNLPSWLKFDPATRTFTATPINVNVGSLTIEVRATDNNGLIATDTFLLTVEQSKGSSLFQLSKIADDIFKISSNSDKSKLQVTLTGQSSKFVNELGVFTVDDAQGRIQGIAPGAAGYTEAALNKAQVIFSAIANIPNGFDTNNLTQLLEFNSGDNLRFYLVKNSSTDAVRSGVTPITDILFSDPLKQKITDLGSGEFSLAWKDGSGNNADFQDFIVKVKPTNNSSLLGTNLQGKPQGEVIDLRGVTSQVKADFTVNREAAYNNFIGFYQVADENGGIDTNSDGQADIFAGQVGYIEAAIRGRVAGIDLTVNNQGTATYTGTFQPGSIFAPFIIANGRPEALLDSNPNNDPAVYFPFLGANADKVDHIRLLGNNVFGFEDLPSGGDKDFNDVVVRVNLSIA